MITLPEIQATTLINTAGKAWAADNLIYLNKPMKFFGSSTKLEKGSSKFDSYVIYLQPADKIATKTLCVFADKAGCKAPCLIDSGQLGMTTGQNAATKRTVLMLLRPTYFKEQVLSEIDKAERKAVKTGMPALFRLNGTSDIDFSFIYKARPNSQFYDYTKELSRVRKNTVSNYDLTFSGSMYSEQSRAAMKKAVAAGYRMAVAFNTKLIASDALSIPDSMANFDKTDLRHLDGKVIGALTRKGSNQAQRARDNGLANSFFVTETNLGQFMRIVNS